MATGLTGSSVTLSWDSVPFAASYEISGVGSTVTTTGTSRTFTLTAGTTYTASVIAKPASGANYRNSQAGDIDLHSAGYPRRANEPTRDGDTRAGNTSDGGLGFSY